MAKYDQGGGCACGLRRYCDCGKGQADGTKVKPEWLLPVQWMSTPYGIQVRNKYGDAKFYCFDKVEI